MKRILIDTNAYTAFMLGQKDVVTTLSFAQEIFISPTVMGELLAGFKNGSQEKKNRTELDAFLDIQNVTEIDINSETAEFYAEVYRALRKKGKPIPSNDLWIAASALQHGLAICTLDAHFSLIDGLLVVGL
ncbi:MAG: type II toxin-antitoxin system VapC family toxin [Verrucomicrobiales bacterium]|nr:type II toxin-antitoxin system VapC family toxin [Verrucomicrobiales bacterium]